MDEQTQLLREIRDLLLLLAEPAISQRDAKLRIALRRLVGRSVTKRNAVLHMNGSRTRADLRELTRIDRGDLSRLLKALREEALLLPVDNPSLSISVPGTFFDTEEIG